MTKDGATYMTLKEALTYCRLSERKLRALISKSCPDPVPHFRVGSKILFRSEEIDVWMERRRARRPVIDTADLHAKMQARLA